MAMSSVFDYMGREFVDWHEPSSSTIQGHLYRVACVYYCLIVLMEFLAHEFFPHELAIQDLPGHDARMRGWVM